MHFLRLFRTYFRKIQIHIVTIFLLLISTSSLLIIFYTYSKSYQSILKLSESIIDQTSKTLLQKIDDLTHQALLLTDLTKGKILSESNSIIINQELIPYLVNMLKKAPLVYSINIATPNGDYFSVINLSLTELSSYYSDPTKPLPPGSKYVIRSIQPPNTESWQYLGTDMKVLASETISPVSYDPRQDSWLTDMQTWPRERWNNAYFPRGTSQYIPVGEPGITVSLPVIDDNGTFKAIVGVNVSLKALSNFIALQPIGLSGKAFILNEKGNLLVPTPNNLDSNTQEIANTVVTQAYQEFEEKKKQEFVIEKEGISYLVYIDNFPVHLDNEWLIAIAVPFNDFFAPFLHTQRQTIFISLGVLLIAGVLVFLVSKHVSVPIIQLSQQVDKIRHFNFVPGAAIKSKIEEIIVLETAITAMRNALRSFTKYIPKEVVKSLIEQGKDIAIGGERKELTILFSDITNFTTTSESVTPEELMPALGVYFDALSKIILQSEGTIDKYIGDSIMSFWGAPRDIADHAKKACITALLCHRACNINGQEKGLPPWHTRFGIHNGDVIVGNIGTEDRINYTVIGDVVNTASRLTAINKEYHTSIMISEIVVQKIGPGFVTRPIDFVAVKGKKNKLTIYELVGTTEGDLQATPEQQKLCAAFKTAYQLLVEEKFEQAETEFLKIAKEFPSDAPTKIHLERLQKKKSTT